MLKLIGIYFTAVCFL